MLVWVAGRPFLFRGTMDDIQFKVGDIVFNDHTGAYNVSSSFHWDKSVGVVFDVPKETYSYYQIKFGPRDRGVDEWGIEAKYLRRATPDEERLFNFIRQVKGF